MLKALFNLPSLLFALLLLPLCHAIGLSIPPIRIDDRKSYSSLKNLANCVGYTTSKDDIVVVLLKSGQKQQSQMLDLHVFDSESNILRSLHDTSGEQMFMFTNLNNPVQFEDEKSLPSKRESEQNSINNLLPARGESYLYICFNNIYTDKSWSFHKQHRDVSFQVSIRNITTLKETNYNKLAKHFNKILNMKQINVNSNNEFRSDFKESDFEDAMNSLHAEMGHVRDELDAAQSKINTLVDHQKLLRNANEDIFESYTKSWALLIICMCAFSACQLIYYKCYLTKRKII